MNEIRVWIGSAGAFKDECKVLTRLLKSLGNDSLIIRNGPAESFDWILEFAPREQHSPPGSVSIYTSGTTAEPKRITKQWKSILQNKRGNGKPTDRWLLTYSPARWAGLSVLAHCLKLGCELIVPDSLEIQDICKGIQKCTHMSLTPSLFRKTLISGANLENTDLIQVTFGGEAATQAILDKAKQIWPQARISHVYASTEFGDILSCSDGLEGFGRIPGELTEDGELTIEGIPTGDLWRLEGNRYIFVGRKGDGINVGGSKVMPFEVEKIMNEIPGVDECRVFGVSSALLGSIVCADYRGTITSMDLTIELRARLPKYAVPRCTQVKELTLTGAGKVSRR
jgi:acyl-CoA synthetase (AMP-forming)/AMP-acid ligase II